MSKSLDYVYFKNICSNLVDINCNIILDHTSKNIYINNIFDSNGNIIIDNNKNIFATVESSKKFSHPVNLILNGDINAQTSFDGSNDIILNTKLNNDLIFNNDLTITNITSNDIKTDNLNSNNLNTNNIVSNDIKTDNLNSNNLNTNNIVSNDIKTDNIKTDKLNINNINSTNNEKPKNIGLPGDKKGDIRITDSEFYICMNDFIENNTTIAIWKKIPLNDFLLKSSNI